MLSIPTTATMGKDRCSRTERLLTKPAGSLLPLGVLTAGSAAATHSADTHTHCIRLQYV